MMNPPLILTDPCRADPRPAAGGLRAAVWLALLLALLSAPVQAAAMTGDPPEKLIFESRPPGHAGGGISVTGSAFNGHTFRVTERTQVTRVGTHAQALSFQTVFMALYQIGTPASGPDVTHESRLLAVTLLDVPSGDAQDLSAPISATLEPGWYALMVGTGRHGATAPDHSVTVTNTGTATTPRSRGPYSVNASTNQMTLQAATTRYFVRGHTLPPAPRPATEYLFETATPAAWWTSSGINISSGEFAAIRFSLERETRLDRVSGWFIYGQADIFAAIVPLADPGASPPQPDSPAFDASVIRSVLIDTNGSADERGADLDGLLLTPGHYAVVLGSGRFGATGSASLIGVDDQIVVPGVLFSSGGSWGWSDNSHALRLTGSVPEWTATPQQVDFGQVPLTGGESRSVTLDNQRDDDPLEITGIAIVGDDADRFSLDADADDCQVIAAADQCSFTVHYQADAIGAHVAAIEVLADAEPDALLLPLAGETVASALVTPATVGNGDIDPASPVLVALGDTPGFTLIPAPGHHLADVGGSCGGTLDGLVFTTDPVTGDCTVQAQFALDPATTLTLVSGSGQDTQVGTAFAAPLVLRVSNDADLPVPGVSVQFQAPAGGASATLDVSGVSDEDGEVSATATANTIAGGYAVEATADDLAGSVQFQLDNLAGPADQVLVISGAGQSTLVGNGFALPLRVRVLDGHDNPVPGAQVDFAAPAAGASAVLTSPSAQTGGDGEAETGASANTLPGAYVVTASVSGVAANVGFDLENLLPNLVLGIGIDDDRDHVAYGETTDYLVTIDNAGTDPATSVDVLVPLPVQLDAELGHWLCLDLDSGCQAQGDGSLSDSGITVPPGDGVRYRIIAPVLADAPGERIQIEAYAEAAHHDPVDGHDQTWLVLFRDGFDRIEPDAAPAGATATAARQQ